MLEMKERSRKERQTKQNQEEKKTLGEFHHGALGPAFTYIYLLFAFSLPCSRPLDRWRGEAVSRAVFFQKTAIFEGFDQQQGC